MPSYTNKHHPPDISPPDISPPSIRLNMEDRDHCSDPDRPEFWLRSVETRGIPAENLEETFEEISIALMITPDEAQGIREDIREWVLRLAEEVPPSMGREGDATKVILGRHIETLIKQDEDTRQWLRDRRAISRETRGWLVVNQGPQRKIDPKMISRVSRREDRGDTLGNAQAMMP